LVDVLAIFMGGIQPNALYQGAVLELQLIEELDFVTLD
jgi:hypothetical protein